MLRRPFLTCTLFAGAALASAASSMAQIPADNDLLIVFNEKPPFFFTRDGRPAGLLVERATKVLDDAKVLYRFASLPFNRIIVDLQSRKANYCALGFSKTREREGFAWFSLPLYKDRKPVLLVRRQDGAEFRKYKSLREMLDRTTFAFGGKQGNVYPIDNALGSLGARDVRIAGEAHKLIQMLAANRFDFTLVFPEERETLLSLANIPADRIDQISYPDIPDGDYRYILCSQAVDAAVVDKLNRSILKVLGRL